MPTAAAWFLVLLDILERLDGANSLPGAYFCCLVPGAILHLGARANSLPGAWCLVPTETAWSLERVGRLERVGAYFYCLDGWNGLELFGAAAVWGLERVGAIGHLGTTETAWNGWSRCLLLLLGARANSLPGSYCSCLAIGAAWFLVFKCNKIALTFIGRGFLAIGHLGAVWANSLPRSYFYCLELGTGWTAWSLDGLDGWSCLATAAAWSLERVGAGWSLDGLDGWSCLATAAAIGTRANSLPTFTAWTVGAVWANSLPGVIGRVGAFWLLLLLGAWTGWSRLAIGTAWSRLEFLKIGTVGAFWAWSGANVQKRLKKAKKG